MANEVVSATRLAEVASATTRLEIVQPLQFDQTALKNELLLFIKPEVFLVDRQELVSRTIGLVLQKMDEYGAQSDGIAVMTGTALSETGAMVRHYGLIDRLSKGASRIITPDELREAVRWLHLSDDEHPIVLGGHEFLDRFPELSADELNTLWLSERSERLRSGFYVRSIKKDGQTFILVNGFEPKQLEHYTDPSHRIVLVLLHSDTDWYVLKNQMVGSTFPDKADPTSIRGTLYNHPADYGFDSIGIENNAVHLSAGPFEAMFELYNFFGDMLGLGPDRQQPLALRRMLDQGIDPDLALSVRENPVLTVDGATKDLFRATEDMNTDDAIKYWLEHVVNTK